MYFREQDFDSEEPTDFYEEDSHPKEPSPDLLLSAEDVAWILGFDRDRFDRHIQEHFPEPDLIIAGLSYWWKKTYDAWQKEFCEEGDEIERSFKTLGAGPNTSIDLADLEAMPNAEVPAQFKQEADERRRKRFAILGQMVVHGSKSCEPRYP
jgi:predicted DNA-binding transcriptional regulator AlpA